jgi:hypothetical protein
MDLTRQTFDIFKMRAIFKSVLMRKLIGKLGVPYNRRLRVRGSPHPLNHDADLSLPAAVSNAFRIQPDLLCLALRTHLAKSLETLKLRVC